MDARTEHELPAIEVAIKSDPGRDPEKQVNEDAASHRPTRFGFLCVVCDGMGGHEGGREASNLAVQTILEFFDGATPGSRPCDVLRDAITLANQRVYALAGGAHAQARPGSTVVCVLVHKDGAEIAHVGDSRCFLVHGSQIFQVTKDHSMVQQLVDAGFLTPAQAAVHPNANQITRALGMQQEVDVEVRMQPLVYVTGDVFVLCSDGLSDLVEPPEILQIVGSDPPAIAAGKLVELANARGGHDNITVIVARAKESARAQPQSVAPTIAETLPPDETLPGGIRAANRTEPALPAHPGPEAPFPVTAPQAMPPPVIPPAPPPPSEGPQTTRRRGPSTGALIGLALAIVAIVVGLILVVMHVHEKQHEHKVPSFVNEPTPSASGN
jgi:protein phosphatase